MMSWLATQDDPAQADVERAAQLIGTGLSSLRGCGAGGSATQGIPVTG
jgi:hypothetical protein